jgi:phosphopantetheine adenylyltransferase
MKSLFQFLESNAVQQATRMGLKSDGHGGWYDNKGEFVAKTDKGALKFFNKRQRIGGQDPRQSEKEKKISIATNAEPAAEPTHTMQPPEVEKTKGTLTIAFGRFNPPTTGHEKLLDNVASSSDDDDYIIVPSRSQDAKKNPLDANMKVSVMQKMFPKHKSKIVNDESNRTIFDVLKKAHTDGYAGVRIVGGADRVGEFEKLANNYNGKLYQFDNLEVMSAGKRDPDSDDVTGMSASKQRKAAAENDLETFMKGVPKSLSQKDAEELFKKIRSSMNIKEGWNLWEIAPKFDWKGLRENYIGERIFRVGQMVENMNNGLVGRIIRRGANHLICVTEDKIMFKSWIKDVSESIVNGTTQSGVPANQREVGTDAFRKYVESMVPGSSYGRHFINKYRKNSKK